LAKTTPAFSGCGRILEDRGDFQQIAQTPQDPVNVCGFLPANVAVGSVYISDYISRLNANVS